MLRIRDSATFSVILFYFLGEFLLNLKRTELFPLSHVAHDVSFQQGGRTLEGLFHFVTKKSIQLSLKFQRLVGDLLGPIYCHNLLQGQVLRQQILAKLRQHLFICPF